MHLFVAIFDAGENASCHNSIQGRHRIQVTINKNRSVGYDWAHMSPDVTQWMQEFP